MSGGAELAGVVLDVQRRLEALYALAPEAPASEFLLDPAAAGGSRTLVSQDGDEVQLGIVLDSEVREGVLRSDPRVRLDNENLGALLTLTEEVSHFLYLVFCARSGRSVTQLELELQGELDKYLTTVFLLSVQNDGAVSRGLREQLFRSYRIRTGTSADCAQRYHAVSRLAWTYSGYLESTFLRPSRLSDLARETRRFYRLGQQEKLRRISALAEATTPA